MFSLTIATTNDAFAEAQGVELARILRELATMLESGYYNDSGAVRDVNGNRVGEWSVS